MSRLIFLHGFTQTHHHWHRPATEVARRLPGEHTMAYIDLPGHGLAADDSTPIDEAAGPLSSLAGHGTWVGYSMGARFALHVAVQQPSAVERLVLIGASPGLTDPAERAERQALDEARAASIEYDGVERFVDGWLQLPMFARLPSDPDGLRHRRRNTAAGLAGSLRSAGTGAQSSLWQQLGRMSVPTLLLAGELDQKFVDIGRQMAETMPAATFATVPGAAHAAHLEQPVATAEAIAAWIVSSTAA